MRRSALLIVAGCSFQGADLPVDGARDAAVDARPSPDAFVSTSPPGGVMQDVAFWFAAEDAVHGADLSVTSWPDRGPAHLDLQADAARPPPMFAPHDAGPPTIAFLDSHLTNATGVSGAITDITMIAVVRDDNASALNWLLYDGTAGPNRLSIAKNATPAQWDFDVSDAARLSFLQTQTVQPVVITYTASTTQSTGGTHRRMFVNGGYNGSDPTFGILNPVTAPLEVGDHVAADDSDSSHHPFEGQVGDLYVARTFTSEAVRTQLETYFALRYAITLRHAYADSSGNTVYRIDDGFGNRVFGLAADADGRLGISLAGDAEAVFALKQETPPSDRSYLVAGDNGGPATFTGAQFGRAWKVENNWKQAVTLRFAVTPASGKTPFLKYGSDPGFGSSSTVPLALVDGSWVATGVALPTPTAYVTLVAP